MQSNLFFEKVDFNPFEDFDIEKVVKLTDSQKEIWLSCILGDIEANLAYNESACLDLTGNLDKSFLIRSFKETIKRHEALRMTFSADGKNLIVYEYLEPIIAFEDISNLDQKNKGRFIKEFLSKEVTTPFDLLKGPLIRFSIIRLDEGHHQVVITAHHIICDGWSLGIIMEDIGKIYNLLLKDQKPDLPLPFQFSEYAKEMAAYSASENYKKIEDYWVSKFQDNTPQLELPTDFTRPKLRTYKSRRDDFILSSSLVESVKQLGKKANSSLVSTLMTVFEVFLYKVTGQQEIVIGLPASGQSASGNFDLVGHCVNLLPLKANVDFEATFLDYLKKRRSNLMDDYDHQQYTFGNLLKKLNINRDPSRIPLVPVVFNIDMGMDQSVHFEGLQHTLSTIPRQYESFEIFLNLTGHEQKLIFEWSYNTDLFSQETIQYWMEGFEDLLIQITKNPDVALKKIPFNTAATQKKLQEWNNTFLKLSGRDSFLEHLDRNAKSSPDSPAVYSAGGHTLSYGELDSMSMRVAESLSQCNLGRGDIVAVHMDRKPGLLAALIGVLRSGAAYLPLDPTFPEDRIRYMLEDSGAKLLITEKHYQGRFSATVREECLEVLLENPSGNEGIGLPISTGADTAYILYTSGSTGRPKGVEVTHLNLLNFLESMAADPGIGPGDRLLALTTISFDIAGLELFLPLVGGASVVLADAEASKDGRLLLELAKTYNITMMQATPATWRMLLGSGWDYPLDLKLLCGGEALPSDLAERLLGLVGPFWNVYGPTETTIWSTVKKIESPSDITVGRPIANTRIYVLDGHLNPVPVGAVGEICIGGTGVARGYLNREELTSEKFVPDPFSDADGARIYRTGDLGRFLPDGEIVCLGRVDHQVKIRGYRIELGEIESSLNGLDGVRESAVIAREDVPGDKRLTGYVVCHNGLLSMPDKDRIGLLREHLRVSLPEYMVPSDWVFMEALPLTANNKVDRKRLPVPEQTGIVNTEEFVSPQTENEKIVANIWARTLRMDVVGLNADFFELGGHSLLAVEVMALIEKETGLNLPLNTVFKFSKVHEFAKLLQSTDNETINWDSLVPIEPKGKKPPIYLIHGAGSNISPFYGLAKNMNSDQPVYGLQARGLNGIDEPLTTIEDMAAHYISEIIRHNPNGPYYLGGQSFGAYVAFEMAKQMKSRGLNIQKVILFDVFAYQPEKALTKWEKFKRSVDGELQKRYVDLELLVKSPSTLKRLKAHSFERKWRALRKAVGLGSENGSDRLFHTIERIRKINHKAMDNYILSTYNGEVTLFKAKIKTDYGPDMEYYGWKRYTDSIKVIELEGDHTSIFEDAELVKALANKLQKVLDE